jgi:hypothetical protein
MAVSSTSTRATVTIPAQKVTINNLTRTKGVIQAIVTTDPTLKLRVGDVVVFDSVGTRTELNGKSAVVTGLTGSGGSPANRVTLQFNSYVGADFTAAADTGTLYAKRTIVLPNGRQYETGLNDITGVGLDTAQYDKLDPKYLSNGTLTDTTA